LISGGIDFPLFFVYNGGRILYKMDRQKLKLIVRNLELLVDSLKDEINSDENPVLNYEEIAPYLEEYDEVYDEKTDY
jgi:hypothetical protein